MNYLLPLLLLLAVPAAGAADRVVPLQAPSVGRELTAQVVGAEQPRSAQSDEFLVFDSYTGASNYGALGVSPRTFLGMPFNLDGAAGSDPMISKVTVYFAYNGTVAQAYNSLGVRFKLWNNWSSGSNPVFSDPPGLQVEAVMPDPITLSPGVIYSVNLTLNFPKPLSGLLKHGIAVNIQGDTGSGLTSADELTPLLRFGDNPIAVGTNQLLSNFGYRNGSGQTDFNFAPADLGSVGQQNQALALKLYAMATPDTGPLVQDGGFEAGQVPTYWAQTSTNFDSPICDASCGAPPHSGNYFVWFGGAGTAAEAGSVQQSGVIEAGPKTLNFYLWWASSLVSPPDPNAYFKVKIDGNTIFTVTPATASAFSADYTLASVDISAYADGNSHTVRFESNNAAAASATAILLDDISISGNLVQDGSFEAGLVPTYWQQYSSNEGESPICTVDLCGGVGPRTGTYWTWLGGLADDTSVRQSGVIAPGPKELNFYLWWSSSVVSPPDPDAYFTVKMDGQEIFSLYPVNASAYSTAYTPVSLDISAYADGKSHTVVFAAQAFDGVDINIDDVSIGDADPIFANGFDPPGM